MASHDPDELWPKLEVKGLKEVRKLLAQGVYGEKKRPVVEEWVHQKEEEQSDPIYMYHPTDAPDGKIFASHQVSQLEQQGWYDSPSMFPEVNRSRIVEFWSDHWKWIIGTAIAIAAILVSM